MKEVFRWTVHCFYELFIEAILFSLSEFRKKKNHKYYSSTKVKGGSSAINNTGSVKLS